MESTQDQENIDYSDIQMPFSMGEDNVIEEYTYNPKEPVQIPDHNAGPQELLAFFIALYNAMLIYCVDVVADVDMELIKDKVEDIYKQIWYPSGLTTCPQYMLDDNGRLMKLCLLLYAYKVQQRIILASEEWATIRFLMACMRNQSTKGRRAKHPGISDEDFKAKLKRMKIELTAEDIQDRMERLLKLNIEKYYRLDINEETGCATISPKENQSFINIDQEEVFKAFMIKNKRSQPSKKRKREDAESNQESDQSEKSYNEEKRPRKARKVTHDTKHYKAEVLGHPSDPASQPGGNSFDVEQTIQSHLEQNKIRNLPVYFNAVGQFMNIAQKGWKHHGMSESDSQALVVDPSLIDGPRYVQWRQSQRNYYPQPQLDVAQQAPHLAHNHNSLVLPQPRGVPHDVHGAPPSPDVTVVLQHGLASVVQDTSDEAGQCGMYQTVHNTSLPQQQFSLSVDDPVNYMTRIGFPDYFSSISATESSYNNDARFDSALCDLFQTTYWNESSLQVNM